MISCPRVLHQWVRGKRPPTSVAAAAVETHTTSRNLSVHHVVTEPHQRCAPTAGQRRPTVPDFIQKVGNACKAPVIRFVWARQMCGIIGLVGRRGYHINQLLYDGLTVLQHRGQDAAGIMTENEGKYHLRKSNGLVKDVFFKRHMQNLLGSIGIGHVRYPTAGSSSAAEAQPFYVNYPFGISLAHNGNLTNAKEIKSLLTSSHRRHVNTTSDSELLLNLLAMELHSRTHNLNIDGELHVDVNTIFLIGCSPTQANIRWICLCFVDFRYWHFSLQRSKWN